MAVYLARAEGRAQEAPEGCRMTHMRFHQRSHPIVLSKESYAAAARAARCAIPRLIARGYLELAAHLSRRADEFEWRAA